MVAGLRFGGLGSDNYGEAEITSHDIVRCPRCRQALGVRVADTLHIVHEKREIEATLPVRQVCHRCGEQSSTGISI